MSTTTTELPYHLTPKDHPTEKPVSTISHKTILSLLNTKCSTSLQHLKQAHALILKTNHFQDHYIAGSLVKSYANPQFGSLGYSIKAFHQVSKPNVFVWNSMIKGFFENNEPCMSIFVYFNMVVSNSKPNKYSFPPLLKTCTIAQAVEEGVQIHAHVVKYGLTGDGYVKSAGIQMYASFGCLNEARNMLDYANGESDVVCCNAMINGYFKCGDLEGAKRLFERMKNTNISSWNAMISGFSKCGTVEAARGYFDKMPEKDDITWSAMVDGYNSGGYFKEALEIFHEMQKEKVRPGKFILSSVLSACAYVAALDQGKWIHGYVRRNSIPLDDVLGTSLLDMYAKCGQINLAWGVFEKIKHKEIFSWNAMIGGLSMHGRAEDAIELFLNMQKEKFEPNDITFVGVLNACAHAGLVNEGLKYFNTMKQVYGVEPTVEHYGCVVDLLGRAGLLDEAEELISSMPMKPNGAVWGALLGACRIKVGNVYSGRYALLSNIYAKAGRWDDAEKVRKLRKERAVKTTTGNSMIDLDGIIHEFKVGDGSHPQTKEIYLMLENIVERLRLEGYLPNASQVLFDIDEEEKETTV